MPVARFLKLKTSLSESRLSLLGSVMGASPTRAMHSYRIHQERGSNKSFVESFDFALKHPNKISLSIALNRCGHAGAWRHVFRLLELIQNDSRLLRRLDPITYTAMISSCNRCGNWTKAIEIFERLKETDGIRLDSITHNAAIGAYATGGNAAGAFGVLNAFPNQSLKVDEATFNSVLAACAKSEDNWVLALEALEAMQNLGIKPTTRTYNTALLSSRMHEFGKRLLKEMDEQNLSRDKFTYATLYNTGFPVDSLEACRLWEDMGLRHVRPDTVTLNAFLLYLGNEGAWKIAIKYFRMARSFTNKINSPRTSNMRVQYPKPDNYTYTIFLSLLTDNGNWKTALDTMDELTSTGEVLNDAVFTCGLSACIRGDAWEEGLVIMRKMSRAMVNPRPKHYSQILARMSTPPHIALGIVQDMASGGIPISKRTAYVTLKASQSNPNNWQQTLILASKLRYLGVNITAKNFTELIRRTVQRNSTSDVLNLFHSMRIAELEPDSHSYGIAIQACQPLDLKQRAIRAYYDLNRRGYHNVLAYNEKWKRRETFDRSAILPDSLLTDPGGGSLSAEQEILIYARF